MVLMKKKDSPQNDSLTKSYLDKKLKPYVTKDYLDKKLKKELGAQDIKMQRWIGIESEKNRQERKLTFESFEMRMDSRLDRMEKIVNDLTSRTHLSERFLLDHENRITKLESS